MSGGLDRKVAYDELAELVKKRRLNAMKAALTARMRYGKLRGGRRSLRDSLKIALLAADSAPRLVEVVEWERNALGDRVLRVRTM